MHEDARIRHRLANECVRALSGCLEWTGARTSANYGHIWITEDKTTRLIHRVRIEIEIGRKLERREHVSHACDNPPCYERSHLILGTAKTNMEDMVSKGRHWRADTELCKWGHPLDMPPTARVRQRRCRTCRKEEARNRAKRLATTS